MSKALLRRAFRNRRIVKRDEKGMATAEYAVGTVAVIAAGGLIYKVLTDPTFLKAVTDVVMWIIGLIMKVGG